jgi:hypothetical protein
MSLCRHKVALIDVKEPEISRDYMSKKRSCSVLNENNGLQRRGSQFDGGMDCVSEIFCNLKSSKLNGIN